MMSLDPFNNLDVWPLTNIDKFIEQCNTKGIKEVNLTGSNTDPLLYKHLEELTKYIRERIPNVVLGIRTNGVGDIDLLRHFDKGSMSITSFNEKIYKKTMGQGHPPVFNLKKILSSGYPIADNLKINVVLCPELLSGFLFRDIDQTILSISKLDKIKRINVRQPYGQPHINDPFSDRSLHKMVYGNPCYLIRDMEVTVWDVHYTEVESVNLYANGIVSITYPVTKGCHPVYGDVKGQENFTTSGRVNEQWLNYGKQSINDVVTNP
jgi:hypothetical protein